MKASSLKNLVRHELIGLRAKVVDGVNTDANGIEGRVVDETRNTLVILQRSNRKVIPKRTSVFRFYLPQGAVLDVLGKHIVGRPEDRVRLSRRRR